MKKSRLTKLACLAMASMLMLTGCGSSDSGSSTVKEDNSLKNVLDKKELILGLDPTFKPMGYTDENDEIVGFDIDVAEEVCKRMGVTLVKTPINWDTKESDLNTGTIDCIWNGMSIDAGRAKAMNLSEPYMKNKMVFVVGKDSTIKTMDDLKKKTIAVQNGSTAQTILEESVVGPECTISALETNVAALNDLDLGLSDAVFLDLVVAEYEIKTSNKDFVILEEGLQEEEEYAVGFRKKDKKLRDEVQKILGEMKADGSLGKISEKWFGADITTVK